MAATTCVKCHSPIDTASSAKKYRGKVYCEACYNLLKQEAKRKDAMAVDTRKDNDPSYKRLNNYICELFDLDGLTVTIQKQIENMRKQKSYSYDDIYMALRYFYEMTNEDDEQENASIGIVPYIMDKAKEFWKSVDEANEANAGVQIAEKNVTVQIIHKDADLKSKYRMEDL